MKILLDECVPQDLCKSFHDHECHAARPAGFGGKSNGELWTRTFDISNLTGRSIAVIVLMSAQSG
jgi:hypothetical protein